MLKAILLFLILLKSNEKLFDGSTVIYNMGTNNGFSVKEVIEMYENGIKLNYTYGERRSGDTTIPFPSSSPFFQSYSYSSQFL